MLRDLRGTGLREPGIAEALVTAVFFTPEVALIWSSKVQPEIAVTETLTIMKHQGFQFWNWKP